MSSGTATANRIIAQLEADALALEEARDRLNEASLNEPVDSYGAEWFLDNYYIVRESVRQTAEDLPRSFLRRLPADAGGRAGSADPRVKRLAEGLVAAANRLDMDALAGEVQQFQKTTPLTMGELWALPALIRAALINKLASSVGKLALGGPASDSGDVVAGSVMSLRAIKAHDWQAFFEAESQTEAILRAEAAGVYPQMDFATRDSYRKAVERVAGGSGRTETEVAAAAVEAADEVAAAGTEDDGSHAHERRSHVGYYLLGDGAAELERRLGYEPAPAERSRRLLRAKPALAYLGGIGVITAALLAVALVHASQTGSGPWLTLLVFVAMLAPAISIAVGLLNLMVQHALPPKLLPKLDFGEGVPSAARTMVVVPALITSAEGVDDLVQQLERHYLGNPERELMFALLTDFADADDKSLPTDAPLLERATNGVKELNRRYGTREFQPFYLLHRERLYNPSERAWMGWERKRGKLVELNRLLRGATDTSYSLVLGDESRLESVRFVLTLDADTRLPPGAAARLIGTLAHPLNRAEFDGHGRVVAGYSLLQPRTDILPESSNVTFFSRLFVGDGGLDPYTLAVSDVYQDLFGSGIYVGKGLYSVDDFSRALAGKVPENSVLSHDLLEGIYGGVGLVTDVVLYEDYPPTYLGQVTRVQRWTRGDWQLLPWLAGALNPRSHLGRLRSVGVMGAWKLFDNLRRSLLLPSTLLTLVLGWTLFTGAPLVWTAMALGALLVPFLGSVLGVALAAAAQRREDVRRATSTARVSFGAHQLADALLRFAITVTFIPFEALIALEGIGKTLYRLYVTRRDLLQWRTAAQANAALGSLTLLGTAARMALALAATLLVLLLVVMTHPYALWVAGPILALWLAAPAVAYAISRDLQAKEETLDEAELRALRTLSRRTWHFFERFVGPVDNWLPPDNVQFGAGALESSLASVVTDGSAAALVAHRTSPTNVGLLLLSTMSAYDLGYLSLTELAVRLEQTTEVLAGLERYRGHLLNWYDTRTLEPLAPRYVSAVDSGNYLAALVAVREGCFELLADPLGRTQLLDGLTDTLDVLTDFVQDAGAASAGAGERAALVTHLKAVRERLQREERNPLAQPSLREYLRTDATAELSKLLVAAVTAGAFHDEQQRSVRAWAERFDHHVLTTLAEADALTPWHEAFAAPRSFVAGLSDDARQLFVELDKAVPKGGPLRELPARATAAVGAAKKFLAAIAGESASDAAGAAREWAERLVAGLERGAANVTAIVSSLEAVAAAADAELEAAEFGFLYDESRDLLHIGYNVDAERLDDNRYDLLASEARLASLVAIGAGSLPVRHWMHLGRSLADVGGAAALLSWSGTMFEYLMPTLLTRRYRGTLLERSCRAAVREQIRYGDVQGVPWGISESGYARVDSSGAYQYRAFGVPRLALDRSQQDELVIAPYASMLAVAYAPGAVTSNLRRLSKLGALGPYGLFEALDFTASRRPLGETHALVRSHMSHHQGMALVALANYLTNDAAVRRFHADPRVATVELLLQEKVPTGPVTLEPNGLDRPRHEPRTPADVEAPWRVPALTPTPSALLLSNGRFTTLITASGAGRARHDGRALTRYEFDPTVEELGMFVYVTDLDDGSAWSTTRAPAMPAGEDGGDEVEFSAHQATFVRHVRGVLSRHEVTVANSDAEVRRVTLVNQTDRPRRLRVTSYGEVIAGDGAADRRHPAFSKLFVESSWEEGHGALLFRRRPRSSDEQADYVAHALLGLTEAEHASVQYETDRARFLGRGRHVSDPAGVHGPLTGSTGATLDPVMALATTVELAPHSQATLAFVTTHARTREAALAPLEQLGVVGGVQRAFDLARDRARMELNRSDVRPGDLPVFQKLLSALLYPAPALRGAPELLAANRLGQPGLWGQGISGDYPVLLVRVSELDELRLVADVLRAHGRWRRRRVKVDVVIVNAKESGYDQELQGRLRGLLVRTGADEFLGARGGVFILREDQLAPVDRTLLMTVARVVLEGSAGSLADQLATSDAWPSELPRLQFVPELGEAERAGAGEGPARPEGLLFDNGLGGFSPDGTEYKLFLPGGDLPPAPWANVIANEAAGFVATEAGLGYTWSRNAGENRLTPWRNDPVGDAPAEVLYLRDEETAEVWSATPAPSSLAERFLVTHGVGHSTWEHVSHALRQRLEAFMAADDPVKVVRLVVTNESDRPRRVTATYYAPWVLGVDREAQATYVVPDYDAGCCALLATNAYNAEFAGQHAFLASNKSPHGVTTDRREFIGRAGNLAAPAALGRIGLSGAVAPGSDPCAALQLHLDLAPGASEEVVFALGAADSRDRALELADEYRNVARAPAHLAATRSRWAGLLGKLTVRTPDRALDVLTNGWLEYQVVSARLFGRTGFYQSSGAYGFRDQLQDVMAVMHAAPKLAREQLLRAARHQFEEGDVLHWWHPPAGRGVRTRISDDLAWLPYVAAEYVEVTGDATVLGEQVPFLHGDPLAEGEEERYDLFQEGESATLLEHCLRALDRAATRGAHGLPLMGTGDWNDGMNRVGVGGKGESVWLAWFLIVTLRRFAAVIGADRPADAARLGALADSYVQASGAAAWDGGWYRRAYFDDGTPLGSSTNDECRIDSIAQAWSVFALGGPEQGHDRGPVAMAAVDEQLVREEDGLVRLFWPPFDDGKRDPGYIKGYLPGVRENGGQYTHGAVWSAWAFASLGDAERAHELYQLLSPVRHGASPEGVKRYKVEPYVMAADVYGVGTHLGRGGWTWYTGSAGWYYRLGVEALLGIIKRGDALTFAPVLPREWPGYSAVWREGSSRYDIEVVMAKRPETTEPPVAGPQRTGVRVTVDGREAADGQVRLVDDGARHRVRVEVS